MVFLHPLALTIFIFITYFNRLCLILSYSETGLFFLQESRIGKKYYCCTLRQNKTNNKPLQIYTKVKQAVITMVFILESSSFHMGLVGS